MALAVGREFLQQDLPAQVLQDRSLAYLGHRLGFPDQARQQECLRGDDVEGVFLLAALVFRPRLEFFFNRS